MNKIIFTGRLGRDAELRYTPAGKAVCSFSVANDIGYGGKKKTQWIKCTLWDKRAEALAPMLTKGKEVTIEGEVTLDEYPKKDGSHGASLAVRVGDVALHGGESAHNSGEDSYRPDPVDDEQGFNQDITF